MSSAKSGPKAGGKNASGNVAIVNQDQRSAAADQGINVGTRGSNESTTISDSGRQIILGEGASLQSSTSDPETIRTAFEFGTQALEAVSQNTERQVSGAVDAARMASEAAARLASAPGTPSTATTTPAGDVIATLKKHAPKLAAGAAALGVILFVIFRRK